MMISRRDTPPGALFLLNASFFTAAAGFAASRRALIRDIPLPQHLKRMLMDGSSAAARRYGGGHCPRLLAGKRDTALQEDKADKRTPAYRPDGFHCLRMHAALGLAYVRADTTR